MVKNIHPKKENGCYCVPSRVPPTQDSSKNRTFKVSPYLDDVERLDRQKKEQSKQNETGSMTTSHRLILKSPLLTRDQSPLNSIALGRDKSLESGNKSFEVVKAQEALRELGFQVNKKGLLCDETCEAVRKFQQVYTPSHAVHSDYQIELNGMVDTGTVLGLDEALVDGFRYKFTVRSIPDVMKNKLNWPKSAELMELWFSKPAKIMTNDEKIGKYNYDKDYTDKKMFSLKWLMSFERTIKAKAKLISKEILWSENAQKIVKNKVAKIIAEKGYIEINNSSLDIISLHRDWQFQYVTVGYDIGVMDDLYGSLGNFGLYAAINKAHIEQIEGETFLIVTEISVYMRDTFEFIGEQYLGHWNDDGMGINLAGGVLNKANFEWSLSGWNPTLGIVEAFGNSDFRDYRTSKGKGGDLLLFSDRGAVTVYEKIKIS